MKSKGILYKITEENHIKKQDIRSTYLLTTTVNGKKYQQINTYSVKTVNYVEYSK